MVVICGVNMPPNKHVRIALRGIYGIGDTRARKVCASSNVGVERKISSLTNNELNEIRKVLAEYKTESNLRREINENIEFKIMVGSYEGKRHLAGLPVRGQRTRTNAKTRKKNRRNK